ncbi:hypothetical protein EJ06DRAFT_207955 [Trichodelitschia bisporula]|uniref:Uncharacterized protein n=1 Tax=Trichodelitschia bisporula TaxID=703511 RepID=A0A6G1I969_9PEZI|nr:hypothetical protein EJ06DRAFT_207955 [Trichodelitschia bisporula]
MGMSGWDAGGCFGWSLTLMGFTTVSRGGKSRQRRLARSAVCLRWPARKLFRWRGMLVEWAAATAAASKCSFSQGAALLPSRLPIARNANHISCERPPNPTSPTGRPTVRRFHRVAAHGPPPHRCLEGVLSSSPQGLSCLIQERQADLTPCSIPW